MPSVDVVLVTYNSSGQLATALQPLAGSEGIQLIVVDNASTDDSVRIAEGIPGVRVIARRENDGFGAGCNVGWRAGTSKHVLFLNPDASLDPQAIETLAEALDRDPGVGAVAPRIVDDEGEVALSQRRFPAVSSAFARAFLLNRLFPLASWSGDIVRDPAAYADDGYPDWVSGACIMVRRTELEKLDGFDDGFFMYCEDMDLCRRLRERGLSVKFVNGAVAFHEGGASSPRARLLPVLATSRIRYAKKHEGRLRAFLFCQAVALDALTHSLVGRGGWQTRRAHLRSFRVALRALISPKRGATVV